MQAYNSPHALSGLSCHLRGICYFESTCRHWEMRSDDNNTVGIRHFSTVNFFGRDTERDGWQIKSTLETRVGQNRLQFSPFGGLCIWGCVCVCSTFANICQCYKRSAQSVWKMLLFLMMPHFQLFKKHCIILKVAIHIAVTFCLKIHITNNQLDKYVCFSGNILHGE